MIIKGKTGTSNDIKLEPREMEFVKLVLQKLKSQKIQKSQSKNLESKIGNLVNDIFGNPSKSSKNKAKELPEKRYVNRIENDYNRIDSAKETRLTGQEIKQICKELLSKNRKKQASYDCFPKILNQLDDCRMKDLLYRTPQNKKESVHNNKPCLPFSIQDTLNLNIRKQIENLTNQNVPITNEVIEISTKMNGQKRFKENKERVKRKKNSKSSKKRKIQNQWTRKKHKKQVRKSNTSKVSNFDRTQRKSSKRQKMKNVESKIKHLVRLDRDQTDRKRLEVQIYHNIRGTSL